MAALQDDMTAPWNDMAVPQDDKKWQSPSFVKTCYH